MNSLRSRPSRPAHLVIAAVWACLTFGLPPPVRAQVGDCCDCSGVGQGCSPAGQQGCGTGCLFVANATCDVSTGRCGFASGSTVDVPGPNAPTVQSAIDSLPNGGTVRIAAGTYKEHVLIDGRQIVLEGAVGVTNTRRPDLPTLKSSDRELGVVTFTNGGGGVVRNLVLQGGAYGIAAGMELVGLCQEPTTTLRVEGVTIQKSGRGIYGSFLSLAVTGGRVQKNRVHGISIGNTALLIDGAEVSKNGGVGLLLNNFTAPAGATKRQILHSIFRQNALGGIEVLGGALPVEMSGCTVIDNKIAGLTLIGAQSTTISNSSFSFNKPSPNWGDGIRIFRSGPVVADNLTVNFNGRAGMSAFGCEGAPTTVTLQNSSFMKNGFHLEVGKPEGCSASSVALSDDGGNSCVPGAGVDGTGCHAVSASLSPAPPPPLPG